MFPNVFSVVVHCPDLEELPNGHFTGNGTSYRSTALYECAEGYLLIGTALRTCKATGQWTSRMPTCTSKQFIDQCCVAICTYIYQYIILSYRHHTLLGILWPYILYVHLIYSKQLCNFFLLCIVDLLCFYLTVQASLL